MQVRSATNVEDRPSHALRLSVPTLSARLSPQLVASTLARLIASHEAETQADLVRVTGLARTTVTGALEALITAGAVRSIGSRPKVGRGRPAEHLGLNPSFGLIMVADVGVHVAQLSIHDLGQTSLIESAVPIWMPDGPDKTLELITAEFRTMLTRLSREPRILALVIGLPGPMDTFRGVPVKPPIMPGWDGFPVAVTLSREFGAPVLVENDANLRALGEARALSPDQSPLLYVKMSTGIGGGLVISSGELHHGADGAAGDIGHVRVPDADDILCACGNYGCIEAVASASAILRQLRELGATGEHLPSTHEELVTALRVGDRVTVQLVREAATRVGEVVANLVHFFNPARVVVGGSLTAASDDVLAGVRAVVYRRALPLATRNLVISHPTLGSQSGSAGGLVLGIEYALTEEALAVHMP
jgi:predicted NBD/HSP70 family sugar kinase